MQFYVEKSQKIREDLRNCRPSTGAIDEISSDYDAYNSNGSVTFSSPSVTDLTEKHGDTLEPEMQSSMETSAEEEAKRRFYSQVLRSKMHLSSSAPEHKVQIAMLYKEALQLKIPEDGW
jgi:hypothetical protein